MEPILLSSSRKWLAPMLRATACILVLIGCTPVLAGSFIVQSGQQTLIGRANGAVGDRTCGNMSVKPVVRVPPMYGAVAIREAPVRVGNPNSPCVGKVISGWAVYYRSHPGYRGPDRLMVSTFIFNGRSEVRTDETAEITVR